MKKLIKCSKVNYLSDPKVDSIIFGVLCSVGIISTFKNGYYMDILKYISCIFVIALILWDYFIKGKKAKIEIGENELLNQYNESEQKADKKYYDKYVNLIGTVSQIEFDGDDEILIKMKSDSKYFIEALVLFPNKSCIKYVENIHKGENITFYGEFTREKNRLFLFAKYLK